MTSTTAGEVGSLDEGEGGARGRPTARESGRHRRFLSRPVVALCVAATAMAVGLCACGGGGPSASGVASLGTTTTKAAPGSSSNTRPKGPTPAAKVEHDAVAFAKCMRSHGITDFPDPKSGNGGFAFNLQGVDTNSPQFDAAQRACQEDLPAGRKTTSGGGPSKAVLLAYAECMRAHGVVNFPDPVRFPGGSTNWGFDLVGQVTQTSPAFQEANQACRSSAYPGIHPCGGSGNGGSKERRC